MRTGYPVRYYVDKDAPVGGDGLSWSTAYIDLQDALQAVDNAHAEIWVAEGVYAPASPNGDRLANFVLGDGLLLYGGFAGFETTLQERDWHGRRTILSGDLNGNDFGTSGIEENSLHVIWREGTPQEFARVDGFTITGGNANFLQYHHRSGGGFYAAGFSRTEIANCVFVHNRARFGGAIAVDHEGTFESDVLLLSSCRFIDNYSVEDGSAIYVDTEFMRLTAVNCTFSSNRSDSLGAAFRDEGYTLTTMTNCTFFGNTSDLYGAIFVNEEYLLILTNCILWDNSPYEFNAGKPGMINHCCIRGLEEYIGGVGNIDADPRFVDPDGLDDIMGTEDDNLRLRPGSPCIDSGSNQADIDRVVAGIQPIPLTDLDGASRFVDDPRIVDSGVGPSPVVDMGATESLPGDFEGDGDVDDDDYFLMEICVSLSGPSQAPPFFECVEMFDLDSDNDIDLQDFAQFTSYFGF